MVLTCVMWYRTLCVSAVDLVQSVCNGTELYIGRTIVWSMIAQWTFLILCSRRSLLCFGKGSCLCILCSKCSCMGAMRSLCVASKITVVELWWVVQVATRVVGALIMHPWSIQRVPSKMKECGYGFATFLDWFKNWNLSHFSMMSLFIDAGATLWLLQLKRNNLVGSWFPRL